MDPIQQPGIIEQGPAPSKRHAVFAWVGAALVMIALVWVWFSWRSGSPLLFNLGSQKDAQQALIDSITAQGTATSSMVSREMLDSLSAKAGAKSNVSMAEQTALLDSLTAH